MLAHRLGFPLPVKAAAGIWVWKKLWKECGFTGMPGLGVYVEQQREL
jgi:hypothetical protein